MKEKRREQIERKAVRRRRSSIEPSYITSPRVQACRFPNSPPATKLGSRKWFKIDVHTAVNIERGRKKAGFGHTLDDPKSYFLFPGNALELDVVAALLMHPQVLNSQIQQINETESNVDPIQQTFILFCCNFYSSHMMVNS